MRVPLPPPQDSVKLLGNSLLPSGLTLRFIWLNGALFSVGFIIPHQEAKSSVYSTHCLFYLEVFQSLASGNRNYFWPCRHCYIQSFQVVFFFFFLTPALSNFHLCETRTGINKRKLQRGWFEVKIRKGVLILTGITNGIDSPIK